MLTAIDGTPLTSGLGGDETLMRSFLRGLAREAGNDDRFVLYVRPGTELPDEVRDHPAFEAQEAARRSGTHHFTVGMSRWLRSLSPRPDVVLAQTHIPLRVPAPVTLIVPDLSYMHRPDLYPRSTRARLRLIVPRQARQAGAVITVSEFSRDDLISTYRLAPESVFVAHVSSDPPMQLTATQEREVRAELARRGASGSYLLYLGNMHPRKNVARAIRAFGAARARSPELADTRFVIAGATWFGASEEERAAAELPPGSVRILGRVTEEEREILLRDTQALIYPSLFEGFGLPPVEAMMRDTPVVAARTTSIPEICGDAALMVDPLDVGDMAEAIRVVLTDDATRARLIAAGRRRAALYGIGVSGPPVLAALRHASGRAALQGAPS